MTTATAEHPWSTGQLCLAVHCLPWHIGELLRRRLIAEPERFANRRVWPRERLPEIRRALQQAGYLAPDDTPAAG